MDPITLLLLGGGGYLGVKKVWPWLKTKSAEVQARMQHGAPAVHAALPMQLDPGMTANQTAEVANLLTTVRNADLIASAAALYRTMNFPLTASVLEARAQSLRVHP